MPTSEQWDELDELSVRGSVRQLLGSITWEGATRMRAMKGIYAIVQDEIIQAITFDLNGHIEQAHKDTAPDARHLVETMKQDLAALHLALRDRQTGEIFQLGVASTPPTSQHQSWLQQEWPERPGQGHRLPRPIPTFDLVPAPSPRAAIAKGRSTA